jgi:hypothetical protein
MPRRVTRRKPAIKTRKMAPKKRRRVVRKVLKTVAKRTIAPRSVAPIVVTPRAVAPTTSIAPLIAAWAAAKAIKVQEPLPQPTPPLPEPLPTPPAKIFIAQGAPSAHVIDLRAAARPIPNRKPTEKTFHAYEAPRTISERGERRAIWDGHAALSLFAFFGWIIWHAGVGILKLIALPVVLGLHAIDEKLDLDRMFGAAGSASSDSAVAQVIISRREEPVPIPPPPTPIPVKRVARAPLLRPAWRHVLSFAGASLAIVLPLQAMNTYRSLTSAREHAVVAGAAGQAALHTAEGGGLPDPAMLGSAGAAFAQARQSITEIDAASNAIISALPGIGDKFRSGAALLSAGEQLANAASLTTSALEALGASDLELTAKLARAQDLAGRIAPMLESAVASLHEVHDLPDGLPDALNADTLASLTTSAESLAATVHGFTEIAPALRRILGEEQERRYLVLFQNNAELRPSGGFVGSFAIVDVDRGRVKRMEVPAGGSYDLQGSLRAHVLAPDPLRLINAKWEFQDGNWFPDFPTTAQKMQWLYTQGGGPSVDGVIAINAPVLSALLRVTGPIRMPEYGLTADADNILQTAQEIVESPSARASGRPKQFIADLLPRVLDRAMTLDEQSALKGLVVFGDALNHKDIQFYFADPTTQEAFNARGWTGRIPALPAGFDALEVVRANIAGEKSDAVIDTDIQHHATISEDGTVTDTTTITLTHHGVKGAAFTGARNVTYLRLYVPAGSALQSAIGDFDVPDLKLFDIPPTGYGPDQTLADATGILLHDPASGTAVNNEFNRTVFGNWVQTEPGASSKVTFTYTLPFKVRLPDANTYGLAIGRQSGAERTTVHSILTLPEGWYIGAATPEGIGTEHGWETVIDVTADRAIGALISR